MDLVIVLELVKTAECLLYLWNLWTLPDLQNDLCMEMTWYPWIHLKDTPFSLPCNNTTNPQQLTMGQFPDYFLEWYVFHSDQLY